METNLHQCFNTVGPEKGVDVLLNTPTHTHAGSFEAETGRFGSAAVTGISL